MATARPDYIQLITEMVWVIEREVNFTLGAIDDDFHLSGLSFDSEFRTHFLDTLGKSIVKVYDQFVLKLQLNEMQSRYDLYAVENETLLKKWGNSGENRAKKTLIRMLPPQKRLSPDECDSSSDIVAVKRTRLNDTVLVEVHTNNKVTEPNDISNDTEPNDVSNDIVESNYAVETECSAQVEVTNGNEGTEMNIDEQSENSEQFTESGAAAVAAVSVAAIVDETAQIENEPQDQPSQFESGDKIVESPEMKPNKIEMFDEFEPPPQLEKRWANKSMQLKSEPAEGETVSTTPKRNIQNEQDSARKQKSQSTRQTMDRDQYRHKCGQCLYATSRSSNLKRHLEVHNRQFPCNLCKRTYNEQNLLIQHMLKMHRNQCSKCKKRFTSQTSTDEHEKRCTVQRIQYECYLCEYYTQRIGQLKHHIKKHTDGL